MSLFFDEGEKKELGELRRESPTAEGLYWALLNRAGRRAASPVFSDADATVEWWHHVAEYLGDGAMAHSLKPAKALASWLRSSTLAIVRRPVEDWVGPAFRDHSSESPLGHLETAHLAWGVSLALDLAPDVFMEAERVEITDALREKGIALCLRWLDHSDVMANWRCVMTAGVALSAAVIGDETSLERAQKEYLRCLDIFQPDGSHGESLQYGNYAAYAQILTWESLVRHSPLKADHLSMEPYARMPRWQACSLFYRKPLSGWGAYPQARSANFNDSGAVFRPSADLLLHISARNRQKLPQEAGLARWLFDSLYTPVTDGGPHDRATFGFINDFGFLSLALLPRAAAALSPEEAGISTASGFSCGDMIARDGWNGRTVLAVHGAGDALHGPGHLHGDLNSFILVHNKERLLLDPGHSCYRNLLHDLETSSQTHNTCTFSTESAMLQQSKKLTRHFDHASGRADPPAGRGGKRLLIAREDDVTVMGSEVAALYGEPITEFSRFWFLCGTHVVFIVDHIVSSVPVKTTWNWLLNNRDGGLDLKVVPPDRLVARRGEAGMKFFHFGAGELGGPVYTHVHDAYHPLPNQLGEGRPGSGLLIRWTEKDATVERTVAHAACMDHYGPIAGWHLRTEEGYAAVLEAPSRAELWKLRVDGKTGFFIEESVTGRQYNINQKPGAGWNLEKL